jgi:hypothetical protein
VGLAKYSIWVEITETATRNTLAGFSVGVEGTYEDALELALNVKNDAIRRRQETDIMKPISTLLAIRCKGDNCTGDCHHCKL